MNVNINHKGKDALHRQLQRRMRRDRHAAWLIHFGGWLVLAMLLVLLWHLVSVVAPLFSSPSISLGDERPIVFEGQPIPGNILFKTRIEDDVIFVARQPDCSLSFYSQSSATALLNRLKRIPQSCDALISMHQSDGFYYLWQLSVQGLLRVFQVTLFDNNVLLTPVYSSLLPDLIASHGDEMHVNMGANIWTVAFEERNGWQVFWLNYRNAQEPKMHYYDNAQYLRVLPDNSGVLVSSGSELQHFNSEQRMVWQHDFDQPIRYLSVPPSAKSVYLQFDNHVVEKWGNSNQQGALRYQRLFTISSLPPVSQVLFQPQSMLGVFRAQSQLIIFNSSTGKVLDSQSLTQFGDAAAGLLSWQNGQLAWLNNQMLRLYTVEKATAVISLDNLFGQIHYEGYSQPQYLWQSTTSADEGEAKYSVVPLLMGSIKAAFLALCVALPLGLGAAVYTAYFAPASGRKWLKPTIELFEAIPSVVIGFIAAIWLLPLSEASLAGLMSFVFFIPLFALLLVGINRLISLFAKQSVVPAWFRSAALPLNLQFVFVYLLGFALFLNYATPWIMQGLTDLQLPALFFEQDRDTHGKNTIVIAIALGLAIAPSIYSLAEDAIFEVPVSLRRASYALGATRLQTLMNVVLKVAYPGILSAIMLGFSRALGETMILLMITGNTPIADWDLVAGMRALTANLAIELPEAEVGSIHYQVLFLTALLLLVFTMAINTVAELLRLRLRKKYQHG